MKTREDLVKSSSYWLTMFQGEVFRLLDGYMEENKLNQKQVADHLNVSPSYVSQILNGNFNFTISKLIDLSLAVGKVPLLSFEAYEEFLRKEKYPDHRYRYTVNPNSDGGCLTDVSISQGSPYALAIGEYSASSIIFSSDKNKKLELK